MCPLRITEAVKICKDLEILLGNCLQVSQLFQAFQKRVSGKREKGSILDCESMLLVEHMGVKSALGRKGHVPQLRIWLCDASKGRKQIIAWPLHFGTPFHVPAVG